MKNLRELRKLRNISQKQIAEYLNITQSTYSKYERGSVEPDFNTVKKLSKYFDISTDYLLGMIDVPLSVSQANFMRAIHNETDPNKVSDNFNVKIGDQLITGDELLIIMETMKKLDQKINGDFFKHKDK